VPRAARRSHRYDVLKAAEAGTFDFVLLSTRGPKAFAKPHISGPASPCKSVGSRSRNL
jgi:hypothetical protein